jgi:hypothetical protein
MALDYVDPILRGESPTSEGNLYDIINYYQTIASPPVQQAYVQQAPMAYYDSFQPSDALAAAREFVPSGMYGVNQAFAPSYAPRGRVVQDYLPIMETGRTYTEPSGYVLPTAPTTPTTPSTSGIARIFEAFKSADPSVAGTVNFPTGAEKVVAPTTPTTPTTPTDTSGGDGGGGGDSSIGGDGATGGPGPSASDVGNTVADTINSITSNPAIAVVDPVSFVIATIAQNALTPSLVAPEEAAPITNLSVNTEAVEAAQAAQNAAAVVAAQEAAEAAAQANAQAEADAAAAMAGHFGFGYGHAGEGGTGASTSGSVGAEGATATGGMGPGDTAGTGNVGGGDSSGASSAGTGGASEGSAGSTAADASSPDGPDGSNASADGGGGGGGDCFTKDTLVEDEHGNKRCISTFKVGEKVKSADGKSINTITYVEHLKNTVWGTLYSPSKDIKPFATANHPLKISSVWVALSKKDTASRYPWIKASQINAPETQPSQNCEVYNLWVTGDGTFIVNGYGTTSLMGDGGFVLKALQKGFITEEELKQITSSISTSGTVSTYGAHFSNRFFGWLDVDWATKYISDMLIGKKNALLAKCFVITVGSIATLTTPRLWRHVLKSKTPSKKTLALQGA